MRFVNSSEMIIINPLICDVVSRADLGRNNRFQLHNGNENVSPDLRAPGDVSRLKFVIYIEKEYVL